MTGMDAMFFWGRVRFFDVFDIGVRLVMLGRVCDWHFSL